jgi:hypothetical protein
MLRLKGIFTGESQINFIKNDEMMKDLENATPRNKQWAPYITQKTI